ncbi:Acetyl esterase/lipase [Burkholderiales bacterium 8X]|nr:Acetyl esterase/lipase [Burkholderiales bacterium 8X]
MKLDRYPPQEPLSAVGAAYAERIMALGHGIEGKEAAYGPDPYQGLTVFEADQGGAGDAVRSLLVFFHGGGWTSGYKEWMHFMAPALVAEGVTFVSAGYRLAPGHVFPTALEDAADAVAWVWNHVANADPAKPMRLFVGGHSAGGHYASLLAVDGAWRKARGLPHDVLSGCLPVSGVYRFGEGSGLNTRPRFLGSGDEARTDRAASPILQIDPKACPPFLITCGSRDFPHLVKQAGEMASALRDAGVPVRSEILEGADHFDASVACGEHPAGWPALAAAWMRQPAASSSHPVDRSS